MEESYQILARKYRPQTFADVVGQEPVVTTLKNSIRLKKMAHAYLFCGTRGTGKTTLVRLFAKALMCPNLKDGFEPCSRCKNCEEIATSRALDVIEIDGASHRGIDDIRQINETALFAPSSGPYKIYIIDEVHMLTKEAFNALLKTLEEPPERVKFFFATTEPHRVLPTILSRSIRFDLMRIPHDKIIEKLSSIARDLARDVSLDALELIARFSEGSLRDAESLLEQILCFDKGGITSHTVNQILGLLPRELFFKLDKAVAEKDLSIPFTFVDQMYLSGKDLHFFLEELIEHYRLLLHLKLWPQKEFPLKTLKEPYVKAQTSYTRQQCIFILDFLLKSSSDFQKTSLKRTHLEMILLKIIQSSDRVTLPQLVERLTDLQSSVQNATSHPISENHPAPKKEETKPSASQGKSDDPILCREKPGSISIKTPPTIKDPAPLRKEMPFADTPFTLKTVPAPVKKKWTTQAPFSYDEGGKTVLPQKRETPIEQTERVPIEKATKKSTSSSKPQSYYDTLMRFAAVELEGVVKTKNI